MLTKYILAAMHEAKYKILADDRTFYGEIPGLQGVYANQDTLEATRDWQRFLKIGFYCAFL